MIKCNNQIMEDLSENNKIIENLSENTKIIKNKDNKYKCKNCIKCFNTLQEVDKHVKTKCVPCVTHNNVFTFKTDTFGKNKYSKDNGGDIYIIQTDFSLKHYYKIGITTNLYNRMSDYRCGAVLEPRIHCYFPIKNIKQADNLLKIKLEKYNIKREIYKCENLNEIKQIIKLLQKEFKSKELEVIPEIKECNICECEYCEEVFTNNYELTLHLNTCENLPIEYNKEKINICNRCNKEFTRKDNLARHELSCNKNNKINYRQENEILKEKLEKQSEEIKEVKSMLMDLMNKNAKIHPKTLQKINKQLNNNGTIINNTFVKFGNLSYDGLLSDKQQREILNKQYLSLEESIKQIHFNKDFPEYSNIYITNMKDDIAYIFNGEKFISVRKNDMLTQLIDMHIDEINISFEKNKCKLRDKYVDRLEKFLSDLNNSHTKFVDESNQRTYPNYKAYKINAIKLLIYNESDAKKLSELTDGSIKLIEKNFYDIDV